jgi:heme-degrading monooxygenase HmoA
MYVNLSIMKPNAGHEKETIDSMHRFSEAARAQGGLKLVTTMRDADSGDLFGIAIWESEQAARAASGPLRAAVENDDFETWVADMKNFRLQEV